MTLGEVLAAVVPSVLAGAVGWQAIRDFFVRPRVYRAHRAQSLVTLGDVERRKRIETILIQQNEPTALVEVEWWNSGRLASGDTTVTVEVPGMIVNRETDENREGKTTPPVQHKIKGTSIVEATKTSLNPRGRCRLVVGFQPDEMGDISGVSVLMYEGTREVTEYRPGRGMSGLFVVALIVAAFATPLKVAQILIGVGPKWLAGAAGLGSMFLFLGLGLLVVTWSTRPGVGGPSWAPPNRPSR